MNHLTKIRRYTGRAVGLETAFSRRQFMILRTWQPQARAGLELDRRGWARHCADDRGVADYLKSEQHCSRKKPPIPVCCPSNRPAGGHAVSVCTTEILSNLLLRGRHRNALGLSQSSTQGGSHWGGCVNLRRSRTNLLLPQLPEAANFHSPSPPNRTASANAFNPLIQLLSKYQYLMKRQKFFNT